MTVETDATTHLTMITATDTEPGPGPKTAGQVSEWKHGSRLRRLDPFDAGDDVFFAGDIEVVTAVDQGDPSEEEDDEFESDDEDHEDEDQDDEDDADDDDEFGDDDDDADDELDDDDEV